MIVFTLVVALGSCSAPRSPEQILRQTFEDAWAFRQTPYPLEDTSSKEDPRLPDMTMEAIEYRDAYWDSILQILDVLDTAALTAGELIDYKTFRYIAEDEAAYYRYKSYYLPFTAEGGFHTSFGFLPSSLSFQVAEDYRNYLVKLDSFDAHVSQHIALMRRGIQEGYTMPAAIVRDFDQTAIAYVTEDPQASIFFKPFRNFPRHFEDTLRASLAQSATSAIERSVNPGYTRLAQFLRETYIPAARDEIAATALPDGEAFYQQCIEHYTTLPMTPVEVFTRGQKEVRRIRAEMDTIIRQLKFEGTFEEFLTFLRTDPQFYTSSPHELLAEASYHAKRIDGMLPRYFGHLPRLPYGVSPVPDEIAPRYTGGRYVPGSYEEHRAGTYWVNTYRLESRPLYVLPALTLHEAVPGHHLQISLAAEGEGMPEFRTGYYISAFGEGWALYTEWLGHEMGVYEDLYQKFGALTYEMWRACRLVVDPGMHAMGWSRERAVQFLKQNTALSLHEVQTEIDRYIGWPGQAVSYKIGELTIRQLRREAEESLGEKFDLRNFHDSILENGSVPLFILQGVVAQWIEDRKANAE